MVEPTGDGEFNFYEQLDIAEKWEQLLEPELGSLVWQEAQRITYEDDPEMQLAGIDHVLNEQEFSEDALQTKVITKKYDNIFYETRHETVDGGESWEGWVYEYDERVILWVWLSDDQQRIVDGRWLLVNDDFRLWFKSADEKFQEVPTSKPTYKDGKRYYSYGLKVPLDKIPSGFIRPANSAVGLKMDTEQSELVNFSSE